MNRHVEKAKEIRESGAVCNCAQTVLRCYADEMGITDDMAMAIGSNFGGGMKCGGTCGAITAGLMVLGALGVENPQKVGSFRHGIADNHEGYTDCRDLLRINAEKGGEKKPHCDNMIYEAIEKIDETVCS